MGPKSWYTGPIGYLVKAPPPSPFRNATVSALIDPQTNTWNESLVDSTFLPFEAQKIKAIPLCITTQPDCLFWLKSSDGSYGVRSGYQWFCSEENSGAASVSNTERSRNFWKKNLESWCTWEDKTIFTESLYQRAANIGKSEEKKDYYWRHLLPMFFKDRILSVLWECEGLRQVWDADFSWINRQYVANGTFENLVEIVSEKPHQLELFAVIAWFLWSWGNKLRAKEDSIPLNRVVFDAKRFLSLHNPARTTKLKLPRPTAVKWRPPNRSEYKTNFDGSIFDDTGKAGLGVVIRNSDGEVMAALSEKIPQPSSVTLLELLAARWAAIFVHEVGLRNSVLEGDSDTIIKAL